MDEREGVSEVIQLGHWQQQRGSGGLPACLVGGSCVPAATEDM